ncbi:MAG: sigma-70 family RNA polymerase sigma factor [Polyangiaceae bacterium]|jgi:RNA polymerase sigma-70 factor (ECF subfamily)|nr:sigma-70 family RNA polymerase sigma factor [Polyangiaceae bacterium]
MTDKESAKQGQFDEDIIRRAQRGERDAVTQLFGEHLATVQRFALRMCRDEERARDIAQESLLTALKSLDAYRGDASFSTWLFTITRSHCGRLRRRADREAIAGEGDTTLDTAVSAEPPPDAHAFHGELTDLVEQALASLDAGDREVILLRDVEGLSTKEAAEVLNLSVASLKSRLHRARSSLRTLVREAMEQGQDQIPMGCPDVIEQYFHKIDGELSAHDCAAIQEHLKDCPACAERCQAVQQILGACASLRRAPDQGEVQRLIDDTVAVYRRRALG